MWTRAEENVRAFALLLAHGKYQRAVIRGTQNLSGSTLKGKARSYRQGHARSRQNLFHRLDAAGIAVSEIMGAYNMRILVLAWK
jgi:hypothetical protein